MALLSCIVELDRLISCSSFLVRVPAHRGRGHNSTKSLQQNYHYMDSLINNQEFIFNFKALAHARPDT